MKRLILTISLMNKWQANKLTQVRIELPVKTLSKKTRMWLHKRDSNFAERGSRTSRTCPGYHLWSSMLQPSSRNRRLSHRSLMNSKSSWLSRGKIRKTNSNIKSWTKSAKPSAPRSTIAYSKSIQSSCLIPWKSLDHYLGCSFSSPCAMSQLSRSRETIILGAAKSFETFPISKNWACLMISTLASKEEKSIQSFGLLPRKKRAHGKPMQWLSTSELPKVGWKVWWLVMTSKARYYTLSIRVVEILKTRIIFDSSLQWV